eukprot:c11497_g1_i1.p1 GENE.c11497_g1_i1~~c11497_g1_i1.p1  ORF type:complete len:524 (-),score=108.94 c11497_g1_i1:117-1688(-)
MLTSPNSRLKIAYSVSCCLFGMTVASMCFMFGLVVHPHDWIFEVNRVPVQVHGSGEQKTSNNIKSLQGKNQNGGGDDDGLHWQRVWGGHRGNQQSAHCIRHGDYSEACLYQSLCDDGNTLYLRDVYGDIETIRAPRNREIDYRYLDPLMSEQLDSNLFGVPFHIESEFKIVPETDWTAQTQQFSNPETDIHVKNAYFFVLHPPVFMGGTNIWHFASSIAMMLDSQFHNETGMYPPMDTVVIRALGTLSEWDKSFLEMMLPAGGRTRVIVMQEGDRVCADNAILNGYRFQLFQGRSDAAEFRERTYKRLGLDIHPKETEELAYPLRVTVLNRIGARHLWSPTHPEIQEMLLANGGEETYKVRFVHDLSALTFIQQVKIFANSDILVMTHGAGLTNMIFARGHVPVIEIFPRHFVKMTYRMIADVTTHPYFMLMSDRLPSSDYAVHPTDEIACEYWHGIDIINEGVCHHQYYKSSGIHIQTSALLSTIELAVESLPMIGYPSLRSTHDPVRPANEPLGTPEAWDE